MEWWCKRCFLNVLISVPLLTALVYGSNPWGKFNFNGFNFSGITLPDPNDFNPYPDPPIRNDPKTPAEIEALLKEYKIIPDVLDEAPKYPVRVSKENHPDSPHPKEPWDREFHHWLVGNIYENNWKQGDLLTEYIGTIPPKKAGIHRFIFIVFEQPKGKVKFDEPSVYDIPPLRKRSMFNSVDFAKKYHFGPPHAVNFFQVKFEDWIPTIRNWTTPLFAPLSSEWTTVFQRSPKPKPTPRMKLKRIRTRPPVITPVMPH